MGEIARTHDDAASVQAPAGETTAIISMIERAARDPNLDLDRMERLLAMRERMMAREAETAFQAAMTAAQAEMPRVYRDAENSHTKSSYARLETIAKAVTPIYTKHGFALSFGTDASPIEGHYRLTCEVTHEAGHKRIVHADLPSDTAGAQGKANKTAVQGFGSTMSYGRRYLTLLIFNVALTNEDNDGNDYGAPPRISDQQAEQIEALTQETSTNVGKFLAIFGAASIAEIPAGRFGEAMRILRERQQTRGGAR